MRWCSKEDAKKRRDDRDTTSHEAINGGSEPLHDEWGRSQFRCIEVAA